VPVEYRRVDRDYLERFRKAKQRQTGDPSWELIFRDLLAGEALVIPYATDKDKRGKRIILGRWAKRNGVTLDVGYNAEGQEIVVARGEDRAGPPPKAGRRRQRTAPQPAET
jgi:hypothetical protein